MSDAAPMHGWICGAAAALLLLSAATVRASEPLPDPTQPPAAAIEAEVPEQKATAELELRAIFHADDRRIAVINGRRVEVSDQIGGARVLVIEIDRVRLERAGEIIELELVSPAFKNARQADERASDRIPDSQGASR